MDSSSWEVLLEIIKHCDHLLTFVTMREFEAIDSSYVEQLRNVPSIECLDLKPLGRHDVQLMISEILGAGSKTTVVNDNVSEVIV